MSLSAISMIFWMKFARDKKIKFFVVMEGAGASLRYGVAGLLAGSSTAWVTDKVYGYVAPQLIRTGSPSLTQSALTAVVGGAFVSVMIYAGDRVLESVVDMDADPLFRSTFYQSAFLGSSTARMAVANVQDIWTRALGMARSAEGQKPFMPVAKNNPVQGPGPALPPETPYLAPHGQVHQPPQRRATPSCQSGTSCGSIML